MGEELYQVISKAVTEGEEEEAVRKVEEALKSGLPPVDYAAGDSSRHQQGGCALESQ
jgi:methanogenic corrinoid protein MtbC1